MKVPLDVVQNNTGQGKVFRIKGKKIYRRGKEVVREQVSV